MPKQIRIQKGTKKPKPVIKNEGQIIRKPDKK